MIISGPERREQFLLDTHTLIWYLEGSRELGIRARGLIEDATRRHGLLVSAITAWEIGLLVSKKRIELSKDAIVWVKEALARPGVTLIGLEPEIAVSSSLPPFEMHPDPADRILVATARRKGATLVTADRLLLALAKKKHFKAIDAMK